MPVKGATMILARTGTEIAELLESRAKEAPKNTHCVWESSHLRPTMYTRHGWEVMMGIQTEIWRSCSPHVECWRCEELLARVANA